jgi:hypothetical protein
MVQYYGARLRVISIPMSSHNHLAYIAREFLCLQVFPKEIGGWLQWEEVNNTHNEIIRSHPTCKIDALQPCAEYIEEASKRHVGSQNYVKRVLSVVTQKGFDVELASDRLSLLVSSNLASSWLVSIPQTLTSMGFEESHSDVHLDPPELARYFFET